MSNKKNFLSLVLIFLILSIISRPTHSLDANKTHPWIADKSVEVWPCTKEVKRDTNGNLIKCECNPTTTPPQACKEFKEYLGEMTTDRKGNPIPVEGDTILWGSRDEDYTWGYPLRNIPV